LDPSAVDLPGGWILVDTCEKPNFGYEYENDPLGRALEELRKEELVEDFVVKESRFNLSPEELKNPKVLETFAKALNPYTIPGFTITIPRAIEFNILGNIYYPQWGDTDTSEWFSDTYRNGERLFGGNSEGNGISLVSWFFSTTRLGGIGFRVIGRFS
ncbi:MAG TPA: hypothetical protein VFQ60_02100, partial [Patescibacteria group bacterium]|nr:hypothetical protein [Patescibacteria group bacterium]